MLRSRTGLLRTYDPLVQSVAALRQAAASLKTAGDIADGDARTAIDQDAAQLIAGVDDQEGLVDDFKSSNALLQNSLSFFNHTARQLDQAEGVRQTALASEIGSLASAMLLFAADPRSEMAAELSAALDRLRGLDVPATAAPGVDALVTHGHLILATLPTVDSLVVRLQAAPIAEQAQTIKQAYFSAYGRAATRALYFRLLLYAVAVGLGAYVCYLFLRLRANARALEKRLALENLIATISTDFINLPRTSLDDGIEQGLARLAGQMLFDRAHIFVWGLDTAPREYSWSQPQVPNTADTGRMLLDLANDWPISAGVDDGTIHVPSVVALPDGPIKDRLALLGLRSWLSIPLGKAGNRSGVLMFEGVTAEKRWSIGDVALLRTAAESFANAIERERSEVQREALQTQLAQSQRLESLGALAGGIAHEFNNILGAILGYGELALSTLTRSGSTQQYVKQIMTAGTRAQSVIDQILAFSRRRERRYRAIHPEPVVAEALELLRASLPPSVALHRRFAADGRGDPRGRHRAAADRHESVHQRVACHERARPDRDRPRPGPHAVGRGAVARGAGGRRLSAPQRDRFRPRHRRRRDEADLRALLHHQGGGQRHRPRPADGVRDRHRAGRRHECGEPARRRQHLRGLSAPDRGAGGE